MAFDYKLRTYHKPLSSHAEQLLESIDVFTGFDLFVPKDLHDTLDVYLDELDPREYKVSVDELKRELAELEKELEQLGFKSNNDGDGEKREEILNSISVIKGLLAGATGGYVTVLIDILGYYQENGRDKRPEISLNMKHLEKDDDLLAIVYVHELMHAYFDQQVMRHSIIKEVEEPLAEYGMLSFMKSFTTVPALYYRAYWHVRAKKSSVGIKCYGFGAYLSDDSSVTFNTWLPEYKKKCVPILSHPYLGKYQDLFKGAAYPRDEKSCRKLLECIIFSLPYYDFSEYFVPLFGSGRPRGRLRVETGSRTIKLSASSETYAAALAEAADIVGVDKVMSCNKTWCKCPLLTLSPDKVAPVTLGGNQKEERTACKSSKGTFYVNTCSNNNVKKKQLEKIFEQLGLEWKVFVD